MFQKDFFKIMTRPKKALHCGDWRVNPDQMVCWNYKEAEKEVYIVTTVQKIVVKPDPSKWEELKKTFDNFEL